MADPENNDWDDADGDFEYEIEEVVMEEEMPRQVSDENVAIDAANDLNADEFAAMDDDEFGGGADDDEWDDDGGDDGNAWGDAQAVLPMAEAALSTDTSVHKSVPEETKHAINRQVDEINMLPMLCGVPDLTAPAVMLGIKIKQFKGISRDQLAVWGLSEYQYIGVRLKFGRWYLHEVEPPTIEIGATNYVSDVGIDLQPFRIAWTLQDRCRNAFFCASDWHQNIKMHDIPNTSAINDLMETTQNTYAQCLDALRRNKNDVTKTTEELLSSKSNASQSTKKSGFGFGGGGSGGGGHRSDGVDMRAAKQRFLRRLRKSSAKVDPMATNTATESQKKRNWRTLAENTSKTQRIRQLAEAFDLDYQVAKSAVQSLGYDIAAEQLTDPTIRAQYVAQYEQEHIQSTTTSSSQSQSGSKKSKWWAFGGSGGKPENKDSDDDDDDDGGDYSERGPYKMEYKVWSNLKKACDKIRNYENMNFDAAHAANLFDEDLKFDDENVPKTKLSKKELKKKVAEVQKLAKNMGLGLNVHAIENAIQATNNGDANAVIDHALQAVATGPVAADDQHAIFNVNQPAAAAAAADGKNDADDACEPEPEEEDENIRKRREQKRKEAAQRKQRMLALGPCPRLTKTASDTLIHEILSMEESMESVSRMFEHNFLLVIVCYILKQLLNSTDNCMICGERLQYPGLKPTICMSPFCQFRLLEIGLGGGNDGGYGLGAEILGNSDICDFLICCACAAAANPQRSLIFFPEAVRGASSDTADESFLTADGKPDVEKLQKVIGLCPAIDNMKGWARQGEWSLKEELGKMHCLLYPYLIWVITSNRALIVKLSPEQSIPQIKSPHQFVMRSQTPERADTFNKKKHQNGNVFFAWHGSGIFNWHSILRMGLKNYSNTKFMSAGAAYGAGIYTAENSGTSLGYCTRGSGGMSWKGSKFGANVCCMALCEIVGPKKTWDKGNGIYVISDEASVATRYFFLFDSTNGLGNVSANSLTLPKLN